MPTLNPQDLGIAARSRSLKMSIRLGLNKIPVIPTSAGQRAGCGSGEEKG